MDLDVIQKVRGTLGGGGVDNVSHFYPSWNTFLSFISEQD
jgi:hypothetical protein